MYLYKNKSANISQNNRYMLAKTISMFEWSNLPESIPYRELERILQTHGYAFITEVGGKLYALTGGLGGEPDVYGNPTTIVISNPALKFNKTLSIADDGVLIRSDDMLLGLMPLFDKFNFMMVENDINLVIMGYNSRTQTIISASDDKTKLSADKYVEKMIAGDISVIGESALFDGIKTHSANSSHTGAMTGLIEYHQYVKANLYNEIGLSANFNMKRERLNSAEVGLAEDALFPFVDNMMKCRLKGAEQLNEKYDLEIDLDYGSVWNLKNKELVDDIITNENENGGDISETTLPIESSIESSMESLPESLPESSEKGVVNESELDVHVESNTDGGVEIIVEEEIVIEVKPIDEVDEVEGADDV